MRPRRSARAALACVAVLLVSHPSNAFGQAAGVIRAGDRLQSVETGGNGAPQRYLVMLEEPAASPAAPGPAAFAARVSERQALARRFAGELASAAGRFAASGVRPRMLRAYDRLIAGAVVLAAPRSEALLRAIPGVRAVFPDFVVKADAGENLAQVRADRVQQELGGSGLGVKIGIVDSGIDYTHPAFGGGFGPGFRVAGGWDFVNGDPDPRDDEGHGTHVAGIAAGNGGGVLGVAPAATLYAFKVLKADGTGSTSDVIAALEGCADPDGNPATDDRVDVVNLSLGSLTPYDDDPQSQAVDALDALGTIVVAAAGNFGIPFTVASPALARRAIAVGAVGGSDSLSSSSSRGPTIGLRLKPDLVAPGEDIVSAAPGGGVATRSGTSMAAPHVAGVAALLRQLHPDWTPDELRSAIVTDAKDLGRIAAQQGSGRLDAYAAATATLFVSPTSLAFGHVARADVGWTRAMTLHVHSRAAGSTHVDLSLVPLRLPSWLEATLSPTSLDLPAGTTGDVTLTLHSRSLHLSLPEPQYIAEGVVLAQANGETCRIPFSIHEATRVELVGPSGASLGLLFVQGRALPALSPASATWLVLPGNYDLLTFNQDSFSRDLEPILGRTDLGIASDTVITVVESSATADLRWALRNERSAPQVPQTLSVQWSFAGGGALAFLGLRDASFLRFPVMKPGFRLEWWAYDPDGAKRYDIPGVEFAPLSNRIVGNDPSQLRKRVEHVHVAPGDSLLLLDRLTFKEGFEFEYPKPFATPYGESFDVVRWSAPSAGPRPMRLGRQTRSLEPALARAGDARALTGLGALWDERLGDTLVLVRGPRPGEPIARFTGRELPFGSGALFPAASFHFHAGLLEAVPEDPQVPALFRDAAGSVVAGAPAAFEIHRGSIVLLGTVSRTELRANGRWSMTIPDGPADLVLRSTGTVAGNPSTTTVTIPFDTERDVAAPPWCSIVAGGGPVERIAFGQLRDPHVEVRFPPLAEEPPLVIEARAGTSGAWTRLTIEHDGPTLRAQLPRMLGSVSLRVLVDRVPGVSAPMSIEIAPAFVGEPSVAANARVVEARAEASSAWLAWSVGVPGASVLVERLEPGGAWEERGERVVDPDGVARFDDVTVEPGGRYGYRLGGSEAAAFVEIPAAQPTLALAIRPNPSTDGLVASVTLDRAAPVTIRVLDLQGRIVASRTWTGLGLGMHALPVLVRGQVKTGLYFVRFECHGVTRDRRVTILQ